MDDCALCLLPRARRTDNATHARTQTTPQQQRYRHSCNHRRGRQAFDVVITSLAGLTATATANHPTIYDARRSRVRYSLLAIGFAEDHPSRSPHASPSEIDVSVSISPYANSPALSPVSLQPFPIAISFFPYNPRCHLTALRRNNVTPHFSFSPIHIIPAT